MRLTHFQSNQSHSNFPHLDDSVYPLHWQNSVFDDAHAFICWLLCHWLSADGVPFQKVNDKKINNKKVNDKNMAANIEQQQFSKLLLNDDVYQAWIHYSFFGRYIQRSFKAFYDTQHGFEGDKNNQFTAEMPVILHQELLRHARCLPIGQTLFVANPLPKHTRNDKVLLTTVNPVTAVLQALTASAFTSTNQPYSNQASETSQHQHQRFRVINHIKITSSKVLAFAVKHNKRTRERYLNQVMVVDFTKLTLVKETDVNQLMAQAASTQVTSTQAAITQADTTNGIKNSSTSKHDNEYHKNEQTDATAMLLREYELS